MINTKIAIKYLIDEELPRSENGIAFIVAKLLMNDLSHIMGDNYTFETLDDEKPQLKTLIGELAVLKYYEIINHQQIKTILADAWNGNKYWNIIQYLTDSEILETPELTDIIEEVIIDHNEAWEDFKNGNNKAIGRLIGAVMKKTNGKANPKEAKELFKLHP